MSRLPSGCWTCAVTGVLFFVTCETAPAQYRAEAVSGTPLGVAKVEVRLPEGAYPSGLGVAGLSISERDGRVFYPAIEQRKMPELVTNTLKSSRRPLVQLFGQVLDQPPSAAIYFLFEGSEPLDLTIQSNHIDRVVVEPRPNNRRFDQLLGEWWRHYTEQPGLLDQRDDYPPVVRNYMTATLSRRFGLRLPDPPPPPPWERALGEQVGLTLASEKVKIDFERSRILGDPALLEPADRPLPSPIATSPAPPTDVPEDTIVAPMAMHVPPECLYIRFGDFNNFLWFQDTLKQWGGDAQNLLSLRGLDYGMTARMEQGLVIQQTALSRLFGAAVIVDVAIVGTDTFFPDGAAYGLLFRAKNNFMLTADFNRQRAERRQAQKDVTEEMVEIGGRKVSYLSSPDGRVRSFYVIHGDFHFITRSRHLAERFLQTADEPETALGATAGFRYARHLMPVDREDTIFVYMSEAFFNNLVSPRYRIETARRLQALADIELVQMAQLAARAENLPDDSIEAFKQNGLLPPEFGVRPDGSEAVLGDRMVADSLRGPRGEFLPIPDVEVDAVTKTEEAEYAQFVDYYHRHWGNLDPVVVGIKRFSEGRKRERVVIDARISPFSRANFDRLREQLGPADTFRLAPVAGNIASFEVILNQQLIFGGLQDVGRPAPTGLRSFLPRNIFQELLVGYVGTDGPLGPLRLLNLGIPNRSDPAGYARSPLGGWRLSVDSLTLFSFQREILAAVAPQLVFEEVAEPAQIRLDIGDISVATITPTLNDLGYARTLETSRGNLRLMHSLNQQLGVPVEECRETAESLLDARLNCPLGGEYVLEESPGGARMWTSTALVGVPRGGLLGTPAPEGFLAPPLNWFRGLKTRVHVMPDTLSAHLEVVMQWDD